MRFAVIRMAPHPIPNRLLPPELKEQFPDSSMEIFDMTAAVQREWLTIMLNPLFVLWEHGVNLLFGRVSLWRAFFTTTWMFRRMSLAATRFVEADDFDFSLQTQSLFDAWTPGVPNFIYTDHTHLANLEYPDFDRRSLRRRRWILLERELYAHAALIFTRSSNISRSLVEQYGRADSEIVCVGAGSNVRLREPSGANVRSDDAEILFVGVDWERKGGPVLVAAFERLLATHPNARLKIVGCNPQIDLPNVTVLGRRPVEEMHEHYEAASIFCLPTRCEPFGVVFVEALHHGLPVVATRLGAIPDLVENGETGFLVEVGDVVGLTAALSRLISDADAARKMGALARERVCKHYTWKVVAGSMAASIRQVLLGNRASAKPGSNPDKPKCGGEQDSAA